MVSDNAPALSKKTSTTVTLIQGSSVKRQIEMQESIIKERAQVIAAANSDIILAKETITFLKKRYSENGAIITRVNNKEKKGTESKPSRKDMVLQAITETKSQKGIMIPEIKESISKTHGISVSSTTIDWKARELVNEGAIYQVNEGRKRGKRFLLKR